MTCGAQVEHAEFGIGKILAVFGEVATVDFLGDKFDVNVSELIGRPNDVKPASVPSAGHSTTDIAFRRSLKR